MLKRPRTDALGELAAGPGLSALFLVLAFVSSGEVFVVSCDDVVRGSSRERATVKIRLRVPLLPSHATPAGSVRWSLQPCTNPNYGAPRFGDSLSRLASSPIAAFTLHRISHCQSPALSSRRVLDILRPPTLFCSFLRRPAKSPPW